DEVRPMSTKELDNLSKDWFPVKGRGLARNVKPKYVAPREIIGKVPYEHGNMIPQHYWKLNTSNFFPKYEVVLVPQGNEYVYGVVVGATHEKGKHTYLVQTSTNSKHSLQELSAEKIYKFDRTCYIDDACRNQ